MKYLGVKSRGTRPTPPVERRLVDQTLRRVGQRTGENETLRPGERVAGNYGTVYEAAGFDIEEMTVSDGDGWQTRKNRDSWEDYERRRWVDSLS